MSKVLLIASNTMRDALRQKLVYLMALAALVLTLFSSYIMKMDLGHEELKFVANFTSGALSFFGGIIAITSICQLFYSELENKTVATLMSKPINFAQFVGGKILGQSYMLFFFCLIIMLVGAASLVFAQYKLSLSPQEFLVGKREVIHWFGFASFGILQFFKLCVISSFACFICTASRSMMFAIVVSFMAVSASLLNYSDFMSGEGWILKACSYILPNLGIFEPSLSFTFDGFKCAEFFAALAYAIIYIFVFGALSVWSFSKREI